MENNKITEQLKCEYDKVSPIKNGVHSAYAVYKGDKVGIVSSEGQIIAPCIYDDKVRLRADGFFEVCFWDEGRNKRFGENTKIYTLEGLMDKTGKLITKIKYSRIYDFKDGLAKVEIEKERKSGKKRKSDYDDIDDTTKYGFINMLGKEVVKCNLWSVSDFEGEFALVKNYYRRYYIDRQGRVDSDIVNQKQEDDLLRELEIYKNNKAIYREEKGDEWTDNRYFSDEIYAKLIRQYDNVGVLECGLARVNIIENIDFAADPSGLKERPKYGFIDKSGEVVIPLIYNDAEGFDTKSGLAEVSNGKWNEKRRFGFINTKGELVWPMVFNTIYKTRPDINVAIKVYDKKKKWWYGFVNEKKEEVIPFIYTYAGGFEANGLSYVEIDKEKFFIKKDGTRADKKVKTLKVAGWTDRGDRRFEELDGTEEWVQAREALVEHMRVKGYRFDGTYHQNGNYGVPYFDNGKKFCLGLRSWGGFMAEVLELDNSDGMAYCDYAWSGGDTDKLPNPNDPDYEGYSKEDEELVTAKIVEIVARLKENNNNKSIVEIINSAVSVYDPDFDIVHDDDETMIDIENEYEGTNKIDVIVEMWIYAQLSDDYYIDEIEEILLKALRGSNDD